jgi:hypothetical protein
MSFSVTHHHHHQQHQHQHQHQHCCFMKRVMPQETVRQYVVDQISSAIRFVPYRIKCGKSHT